MSQHPKAKLSNSGVDFTPTIHSDTYDFIKPEQFDLKGRAVLITGASKGIGKETSISYARAGASQIAIAARSGLDEVEKTMTEAAKKSGRSAPQVLKIRLDVSSRESVDEMKKQVEQTFGKLDILVNNAGYLEPFVPLLESDPDEWWKVWEVNIKGVYLVTRALLPLMLKAEGSLRTVLNVSSIGANLATPGGSGYQAGKLALLRLGEFLVAENGANDVISFGIHPGGVPTELALGMPKALHVALTDQPILAADSIVWLTAERRKWLNGRYVSVTWDMAELLQKRPKIEESDLLKVRLDVGLDA